MFQNIGEIVLLFWRTLCALPFAWRQRQKVFDQFFEIGNASLLMVCVLSFFTGASSLAIVMPTTPPTALARPRSTRTGPVCNAITAPMMMAILIAGRIGSAMAAEI